MLYFTRWKALAIILTALVVCLCAVPNFFPEARVKTWPAWAQRHLVLGLDLQGGSYLLLEVDSNYVKKEKLDQIRDDARQLLRAAKIVYTGLNVRNDTVEVRITKDTDLPTALSKLREMSQPLGGLLGSSGQRSLAVTDAGAGGHHRADTPDHRAVDPDRRAPRQRTWNRGALDPASGYRPHPGAGAGPARPNPIEGITWQNRQDGIPDGRSHRAAGSGAAREPAAGFGGAPQRRPSEPAALCHQERDTGLRRGPDRRPTRLRPAQRPADRVIQIQWEGLAEIREGDNGARQGTVRNCAGQQGDLGAGHPGADHRRLRPDFRQFHGAGGQ